jgi:hypothetical protein
MGCAFEGKVEAHDTVGILPTDKIFKVLGKDAKTGYILLHCPSCGENIAVDPLKSFFGGKMKGYPVDIRNAESIAVTAQKENMESDVSQRVPCSDNNCIGTINDQEVCNICGKPYIKKSMREGENVQTHEDKATEISKDTMDYDDALDVVKKRILKLAKNNFILWLVSIIIVFIARSTSKEFLNIITLIILVLILIKSIKLSILIKKYFNILYEMYGPHPNQKRNSLIVSFVNVGILGLVILLFIEGSSNWYIIPLISLSLFMFVMLGASLSGK